MATTFEYLKSIFFPKKEETSAFAKAPPIAEEVKKKRVYKKKTKSDQVVETPVKSNKTQQKKPAVKKPKKTK